jgi:stage III sporulation protein AG
VKKNELLSALRSLQSNKNRTALAVTVGVMAMLLLLLSELLPSGNTQKTAASTVQTAAVSQLEQQLEGLISQLQGAGRTTVMVTLTTGEETIYAVDTRTGDLQQQETHVLLQDGSALAETTYLPQVCGVAVLCEGGGDVRVAARITELLHSLLDLPTNRICVEQRKC